MRRDASYDYVNVGEQEDFTLPEPLGWELIHPELFLPVKKEEPYEDLVLGMLFVEVG